MADPKRDKDRKPAADGGKEPKSEKNHLNELLDEALEETFPASDPPAVTRPPKAPPKTPPRDQD